MRNMILLALVLGMVLSTVAPGVVADDLPVSTNPDDYPPCRPGCLSGTLDGDAGPVDELVHEIEENWPPCRPNC